MAKGTKQAPHIQASFPNIKDWQAIVVIVASVVIFFSDILLQKAFMWEDFLYQVFPWRNFVAVSLANFEFPLWNPYTFNGMPFFADIPTAVLYIPNLILTLFVSGNKLHYYWVELSIILHYMIAGLGMYYLLKNFKLENIFSLFGAFVFTLSGFMITHGIHIWIISHVAWLPWIFLLFKKTLEEKSFFFTIVGGLILGHSVLAGFPQLSLYIFFLLFLFFVFEFFILFREDGIKNSISIIPYAAGVVIIALAIIAIQLLPTLELAPLSVRAEITYEKSQEGTLAPQQLITLLIPKFFGEQSAAGFNYWGPGGYAQYWETNIYLGISALIFVIIAILFAYRNRYVIFFSFIAIFALLYAMGDNFILHKFFFFNIPGFQLFRNPGRMSLWFTFASAILCSFGLKEFLNFLINHRVRLKYVIISCSIIFIFVWILAQTGLFQNHTNPEFLTAIRTLAREQADIFLIIVLIICGTFILYYFKKLSAFWFVIILILIHFIDIYIFGFNFNNGKISPIEYRKQTEQLVNFLKEDGKREYFRINSRQGGNMILDRNQGLIDRIFLMEGYTPLTLQRTYPPAETWDKVCDLMNAKYRIEVNDQNRTMQLKQSETYLPRSYFVYDYKVINDESKIKEIMTSSKFDPRKFVILEEYPQIDMQTSNVTNWNSEIINYKLNIIKLKVSTPQNGILVLSEIYFPGWKAYVDGVEKKVYRCNWNQRAIPIAAGNHNVEVKFEPASFYRGAWISSLSLLFSFISLIFLKIKKIKNVFNRNSHL